MQGFDNRIALEWPAACGRFKQDATEREDVRALIDLIRFALRLFRRHVADGAHDGSGRRVLRHNCGRQLAAV